MHYLLGKKSKGHNSVIINGNNWKDNSWKAIGIGIYNGFATFWFGEESEE